VNLPLIALPYAPSPQPDELLSSWIERIGLFYNIGYLGARVILEPSRTANERTVNEDLDSSESVRKSAILWSGFPEKLVPELLARSDEAILEVSARLSYCPECWNEDAEQCRSPYVRKAWARWSSVTCPEHKTWLYAREPYSGLGSELNGWASVWQTNPRWAETAHVRHDPALRSFALGLEGHAVAVPDCSWSDLDRDFDRLAREPCCFVLARVATPEHAGMRNLVWESLEVGGNSRRIVDAHLRGYNRLQPGWIAGRISCMVIAVEVLRILEGQVPAIKLVRTAFESHPAAERLVSECKALQSQNSCH
jgi:hypothetical protein